MTCEVVIGDEVDDDVGYGVDNDDDFVGDNVDDLEDENDDDIVGDNDDDFEVDIDDDLEGDNDFFYLSSKLIVRTGCLTVVELSENSLFTFWRI